MERKVRMQGQAVNQNKLRNWEKQEDSDRKRWRSEPEPCPEPWDDDGRKEMRS